MWLSWIRVGTVFTLPGIVGLFPAGATHMCIRDSNLFLRNGMHIIIIIISSGMYNLMNVEWEHTIGSSRALPISLAKSIKAWLHLR